MNILIIGRNSQLGKTYQDYLKNNETKNNFEFISRHQFNYKNKSSISKILKLKKYDFIVNFAAYTNVEKAEIEKKKALELNAIFVDYISLLIENNTKIIHISSDYVFDGTKRSKYLEKDKTNPINFYGLTKLKGEENIFKNMKKNALIIRTSWLYSNYNNNFVLKIIENIKQKKNMKIVNDQIGSPTNAYDLVKFINLFINNSDAIFKTHIIHFSNSGKCTWFEFAQTISSYFGDESLISPTKSRDINFNAKRPKFSVLNCRSTSRKYKYNILDWKKSLNGFFNKK